MDVNRYDEESLRFHSEGRPGKLEVVPSKPCHSDHALSLAYTPGVAAPCKAIALDPERAYEFTGKGNLVAVITNGTAVLGLGNIGPLAGKPVMEGKAILFKKFADIDVFDLEIQSDSPAHLISTIKSLEPTFGAINLEDIRAPECFEVEEALKREMSIPVLHDDQHGTAIVVSAALINSCFLTNRDVKSIKIVFCGSGAAAIACARLFLKLGITRQQITMCDVHGVVFEGRTVEMDRYKSNFAQKTEKRSLKEALVGADVLIGLSAGRAVTSEMILDMKDRPIIFALANPTPEIDPAIVRTIHPTAIIATGRSDFPNQVNNLLGFPYIFRGALDVRATEINSDMMLAAVHAIANLAREDVPDSVSAAYSNKPFKFGSDYILPKPFDSRVLLRVTPAVAKAAMSSGVAKRPISNFDEYIDRLEAIKGPSKSFIRTIVNRVHSYQVNPSSVLPRIIFPEGADDRILKAVNLAVQEGLIQPILIGRVDQIREKIVALGLSALRNVETCDPDSQSTVASEEFLLEKRKRKGITVSEAKRLVRTNHYYAAIQLALDTCDGLVAGASETYANCLRPALDTVGVGKSGIAAGLNLVLFKGRVLFFTDTSINVNPDAEQLAKIAVHASRAAKFFGFDPKIAMLSYSNFTGDAGVPAKMKLAMDLVARQNLDVIVDGEMQADTAVNPDIMESIFPFCKIKNGANILVFPNLESGNISYKLLQQLGGGEVLGPFVMGLRRPANIVPRASTVEEIYNSIAMTALQALAAKEFRARR